MVNWPRSKPSYFAASAAIRQVAFYFGQLYPATLLARLVTLEMANRG